MSDSIAKELVSIVVPFFRTEYTKFQCCIKSLIKQSYEKLEIVVVDDGSGDEYSDVLTTIGNLDCRIIVYKMDKNSGLSAARNFGLSVSKGEYVIFVDSDDVLNSYAIESLYYHIVNSECDMAIGGLSVVSGYSLLDSDKKPISNVVVMDNIEALKRLLANNGFGSTACGRLAKKTVWEKEGKPFIEGVLHEDLASMWNVIYNCNKIVWCKGSYYYYYQGNSSSIHKKNVTAKFVKDFFDAMNNRNKKLAEICPILSCDIANSYIILCPQIFIYASICEDKSVGLFYSKDSVSLFKKNYSKANEIVGLSLKQRAQRLLFYISPGLFKLFYIISRKISKRRI